MTRLCQAGDIEVGRVCWPERMEFLLRSHLRMGVNLGRLRGRGRSDD